MDERLTEIQACLRTLPLFQPLSKEELAALASRTRVEEHEAANQLFLQGDAGDSYYIVNDGSVEITITLASGKDSEGNPRYRKIRKIVDRGGAFGEMSLLTGAKRAGDAKTRTAAQLLVIDKAAFRELLLANQTIAAELGATMLRILESNQSSRAATNADTLELNEEEIHKGESDPPSVIIEEEVPENEESLLKKIKGFFGLS